MTSQKPRRDLPSSPGASPPSHGGEGRLDSTLLFPDGPASLTVSYPEQYSSQPLKPSPSRWGSLEYVCYCLAWCYFISTWVTTAKNLSNEKHPNFARYEAWLSNDWTGRRMDNSDLQYRHFRSGLPSLIGMAAAYLLLSKWYARTYRDTDRLGFLSTASLCINFLLHGLSSFKILGILVCNFILAKSLAGRPFFVPLIWFLNVALLFANELYDGYRYATLFGFLAPLDGWSGLMPRWHILFNFSMLRILSFCLDWHWARAPPPHKARIASRPVDEYNLSSFVAYTLYPPLYIAGPIISFDDFITQLKQPPALTSRMILGYLTRWCVCFATMEWILHNIFVVAIKNAKAWEGDSPQELAMIGMWNLIIIWLKLLIPWRFFRLWALLDGIDPPENMVRCVMNNYSTMGFWRSWHRSYNRWLLRYLYAPLGGSLWSRLLIFTFVAVWHDLRLHLFVWGWAIFLFILPEFVATRYMRQTDYGDRWWYRHICALGAAFNILAMITANLIGFALGTDGALYLFRKVFSGWEGAKFAIGFTVEFFTLAHLQFEYREMELRRGINRKC